LVIRCFFIDYFKISPAEIGVFRELLLITAIVSFISIPYNYLEQLLSGVQEIAFNAKMQMIKNVLFACLVFFVSFKPHSITLVQFYALNCFTMIAVIPWQVLRWLKYGSIKTFLPRWYFKETLPLFKYCLNLFVMGIFIIMADKLKPLILTLRVSGSASLKMADYQIIYNIILFLNMITSSFITVLIPYIAREYVMGNHGIYKKVIQETTKLVWGFGAFLIFTMITFSKEILLIYVGPNNVYLQKWLIFYLVGYLYVMYAPCISAVVLSSGRMLPYTVGTALGCVVSLIFCWFTVPISPMGGMVFSYIVYIIIIFFTVHFYYLPKMFNVEPIRQIFRVLIPPLVVGVCMVFLTRYFLRFLNIPNIYANTLIGTFVGFIVYIVMILIVYIKPKELRLLLNRLVPVRGNN
jgi:O-antigen/teichoic acid export membrane protein